MIFPFFSFLFRRDKLSIFRFLVIYEMLDISDIYFKKKKNRLKI